MSDDAGTGSLHDPHRLTFLTDGVVAIAVTLLALDLKPDLPHGAGSAVLAHDLRVHSGQYVSFALAFWLIARYWMMHHRIMRPVRALDGAAMWATMLFLFAITCLPLTTYVTGTYPSPLATTLFASSLLLASLAVALLDELIQRRGLSRETESAADRVFRRWQMIGAIVVPMIVIALAWVLPHAEYFFLLARVADVPARIVRRRVADRGTLPAEPYVPPQGRSPEPADQDGPSAPPDHARAVAARRPETAGDGGAAAAPQAADVPQRGVT